jgi:hypothetical protein
MYSQPAFNRYKQSYMLDSQADDHTLLALRHAEELGREQCMPNAAQNQSAADLDVVPLGNDVLLGRGGKNNQHIGNARLRTMAREVYPVYRNSPKKDKPSVALLLVEQVQSLKPAGR